PLSFIADRNLEMNSPTSISLSAMDTANGGAQVMIKAGRNVSLNLIGITAQPACQVQGYVSAMNLTIIT
ncbi:hypothetical protein N4Q71_29940, partial [Salmonella enterica subsp. enterica serovar Montevideo]